MRSCLHCVPFQISPVFSQNSHSSPAMNLFMFTKYPPCCPILFDYINGGVTLWLRVTGTLLPSPILRYGHRTLLPLPVLMYEHSHVLLLLSWEFEFDFHHLLLFLLVSVSIPVYKGILIKVPLVTSYH